MEPVARDQREMVRYTRKRKGEESRSDFRKEKMKEKVGIIGERGKMKKRKRKEDEEKERSPNGTNATNNWSRDK